MHWVLPWICLTLIIGIASLLRLRLIAIPLERDEGEYAYIAQLMTEGIPPYGQVYTMKLPGTPMAYAAIMQVFGQTPQGIHLGLLFISAMSTVLLFLLAKRFFGLWPGIAAALTYAFLSLSPTFLGMHAHATHFVMLFVLAAFLLLLRAIESGGTGTALASGICFGLSYLMKQQGIFFVIFAFAFVAWNVFRQQSMAWRKGVRIAAPLLVGALIPFAAVCAWLWNVGVFEPFWFWTFTYAREYASRAGDMKAWTFFARGAPFFLVAIILVGAAVQLRGDRVREGIIFTIGFLIISILALVPGCNFRRHYFILLLPAAALVIAAASDAVDGWLAEGRAPRERRLLLPAVIVLALGLFMMSQRGYLSSASPAEAARMTYGPNPFPEAPDIARILSEQTEKGDRIAILGSEPEIFFYAKRRSATGYIYMYEMMEEHPYAERMQREMISEIERSKPAYVVDVRVESSWSPRALSSRIVFDWLDGYTRSQFDPVDTITIAPDNALVIYKRRGGL